MADALSVDFFLDPCCGRSWSLLAALDGLFDETAISFRQLPLTEDVGATWRETGPRPCVPVTEERWARAPVAAAMPLARAAKAVAALGGGAAEGQFLLAISPLLLEQGPAGVTREALLEAARVAGVDPVAFALALGVPDLEAQIRQDVALARSIGLRSTPAVQIRNAAGGRVLIEGEQPPELYRLAIESLGRSEASGLLSTPIMPEIAQVMPDEAPTG